MTYHVYLFGSSLNLLDCSCRSVAGHLGGKPNDSSLHEAKGGTRAAGGAVLRIGKGVRSPERVALRMTCERFSVGTNTH